MKNFKDFQLDEAPLVMSDIEMVDAIMIDLKNRIASDKVKGKFEKHMPIINAMAKYMGYGITKKGQAKGKSFRYDLKKR
tara:strand:+ start:569 stop:805 length:237 start_codon:yes stop_codon:yes gene_type:complete